MNNQEVESVLKVLNKVLSLALLKKKWTLKQEVKPLVWLRKVLLAKCVNQLSKHNLSNFNSKHQEITNKSIINF